MKRVLIVGALLIAGLTAAQVTATFFPAGVNATDFCVHRLPDGGATGESWGQADGGTVKHGIYTAGTLTGPRQVAALNLLNTTAQNLLLNSSGYGDGGQQ